MDGQGCYRAVFDAVTDDVADGRTDLNDNIIEVKAKQGTLAATGNPAAVDPERFSEISEVSEVPPEVVPPLPAALQEAQAEIAKLRAENEQLLNWITGTSDALTCLQSIYQNPASSEHTKIKAATGALPFERPKLSVAVSVRGSDILGQCLDDAKAMKTINPPKTN